MTNPLWCDRRLTVRVDGPDGTRTVDVGKPYARIGSQSGSEVLLPADTSPRHGLYLHATARGIFSVPLTPPTQAGRPRGGWVDVRHAVELGPYRIHAFFEGGEAPEVDPARILTEKGSAELPVPVIYVMVNEVRRAAYRMYRSLAVVGRDLPSALRLRSEFISTTHCVLYWQEGKLWFVDLLSSNGTLKRGRRCDAERLRLGRTIAVGDAALGFARTTDDPWLPAEEPLASHEEGWTSSSRTGDVRPEIGVGIAPRAVAEPSKPVDEKAGDDSSRGGMPLAGGERNRGDTEVIACLQKEAIEAIQEMQLQLARKRAVWEGQRDEQQRRLDERNRDLDAHFAEIESWRDELASRTQQIEHDLTQWAAELAGLEEKKKELHSLESTLTLQQRQARELLAQEQAAVEQLQARHAEKERELQAAQEQLEHDRAACEELRRAVESQQLDQAARDRGHQAALARLARDRAACEELRRAVAAQQLDQGARDRDHQAALARLALDRAACEELRRAVEAQQLDQAARDRDHQAALARLARDRAACEELRRAVAAQQLDQAARDRDHQAALARLALDRAGCDERQRAVEARQIELERQAVQQREAGEQLARDRQQLASWQHQLEARQQALADESQAVRDAGAEMESARRARSDLQQEADRQVTRLRDELDKLTAQFAEERQLFADQLSARDQELETIRRQMAEEQRRAAACHEEFAVRESRLAVEAARLAQERADLAEDRRALVAERARLEEFALEQAEQLALLEREREREGEWGSDRAPAAGNAHQLADHGRGGAGTQEDAESSADQDAAACADDHDSTPVLGRQFEEVDPVLFGQRCGGTAAARADAPAERPRVVAERIPVDPVADEAYEELVDRLVHFNYAKKKKWYQFW